jgi:hypothetical protein
MTPTTQAIRLQMQQQARIRTLSDAQLDIEIERAERRASAFDTAETKQWFAEIAARDANYCWLMALRDEREDRSRARARTPDAVLSAMETETLPLPDAVAAAWDTGEHAQ